ncbi:MAG: STAS domain-containing protein [Candidatus Kapaibacterium sp.]
MLRPRVQVTDESGVRVLAARGEFVGGKETDTLREAFAEEAEKGTNRLLIDLADVTYLNSSALGVLISAHTNFSKREGKLGLCNVSDGITNIFVITKLSLVFNVYGNREEGLAALSAG